MIRLLLILVCLLCMRTFSETATIVPVVYIMYGAIPDYLMVNIELALRHNPVIVITDTMPISTSDGGATFVEMRKYKQGAKSFELLYKHMAKDKSEVRVKYELHCFTRWYILRDYMTMNKIDRVFFGDSDTAVFTNMTDAFDKRSSCSAVINVEHQGNLYHWVGAGESSLWTLEGITAFLDFNSGVYYYNLGTVYLKYRDGSTVTDMSALWLWWVATHRSVSDPWATGRPYQPLHCNEQKSHKMGYCVHLSAKYDEAFNYAKTLKLPALKQPTAVCNGLDVVNRTVFDHYHGWFSGKGFSFNLEGDGVPSFHGLTGRSGGIPESLAENELKRLEAIPVRLLTLHYQGDAKRTLPYDVCRVLLMTGTKTIKSAVVSELCSAIRTNSTAFGGSGWPNCIPHINDGDMVCV